MFNFFSSCFHVAALFFLSINPFHTNYNYHHHMPRHVLGAKSTPTPTFMPTTAPSITLSPTSTSIESEPTVTVSPTDSPTPTATPTPTLAPTDEPTWTPTPSPIESGPTDTPVPTATPTIEVTPTPTPMDTMTIAPTDLPTSFPTPIESGPTEVPTQTPTPTIEEATPTASPSPTLTETPTVSPTATDTPTATPTSIDTPTPTPTITKIGNDVSYPQCGKNLPSGQGFGIVGINGGIAYNTNPCLSVQLLWAANQSLGTLNQDKLQLYVNTGNPGGLNTPLWPHDTTDPTGAAAPNPYGVCDGSNSISCAWQYGWNRAVDDVQNKFSSAAQSVSVDATSSSYLWWLDVETTNSWNSGSDEALQRNRATLEAMVSYFHSKGIRVGIYSTSFQFGIIAGSVPSESNLNGLRSWLPGASSLAGAQANCFLSALTTGGSVVLTQYTTSEFDYDFSCL